MHGRKAVGWSTCYAKPRKQTTTQDHDGDGDRQREDAGVRCHRVGREAVYDE